MEAGEFIRSGKRLLEAFRNFKLKLSKRDVEMIRIGMRASHIEEALAMGDIDRANAHFSKLGKELRGIEG